MKVNGGLSPLALLGGLGFARAALPANAQQSSDADGMVEAIEAATCDEQRFGEATGGQEEMTLGTVRRCASRGSRRRGGSVRPGRRRR